MRSRAGFYACRLALGFAGPWLAFLLGCGAPQPVAPPIQTAGLLREMTDLTHLARFPDPVYQHRLASSTDPSAHSPQDPDTWFKNEDLNHYVRTETREGRTEYVLLDTLGPGVVMRIWSANPAGTLRIYIDGAPEPALEADMKSLLRGKVAPFSYPFAYEAARGSNLYFPLAYRKHCKITMDEDGAFYQVNFRTYPKGTDVVSFEAHDLAQLAALVRETAHQLVHPGSLVRDREDVHVTTFRQATQLEGPAVVLELSIRPPEPTAERLRSLVLVIRADGHETVRVPLGDFFGSGPGHTPYESLVASVSADGLFSARWPMPFEERLELEIEGAKQDEDFQGKISLAPWQWDERSLAFHASWRHDEPRPSWPPRDWTLVSIKGRGLYAGTLFEIANSTKAWWGEGDEKVWVDGENFPSHFGTGTEDYFGYAWSTPITFARPYHSQTLAQGPGGYGWFSMNRWHVLDPIPFTRSLIFDQEIWHWSRDASVALAAVSFFYADRDARSNGLAPRAGSAPLPRPAPLPTRTVRGALEAERMKARASGGRVEPERMVPYLGGLWSEDTQVRWRAASPGDRLELFFAPAQAGRYRVRANLTRGPSYGVHRIAINAEEPRGVVDLGSAVVGNLDDVDLGVHDLRAKENQINVEVLGSSEKAPQGGTDFGLDLIWLQPAP